MDVAAAIRLLEALQDQWEDDIAARHTPGDYSEFQGAEREAWLLGMAVGYANAYREAADLLRGCPRPGGVTFTAQGPVRRGP